MLEFYKSLNRTLNWFSVIVFDVSYLWGPMYGAYDMYKHTDLSSFLDHLCFLFQVKVQGQNMEMLQAACQQFLGKREEDIRKIALETLEGHQRAIMGNMTVEVKCSIIWRSYGGLELKLGLEMALNFKISESSNLQMHAVPKQSELMAWDRLVSQCRNHYSPFTSVKCLLIFCHQLTQ